ncbi:hypothetical protein EDD22DRAFT_870937, partial [Suillus occidentalis]
MPFSSFLSGRYSFIPPLIQYIVLALALASLPCQAQTFRLQSHTIAQSRHNEDPYRLAVIYRPCTSIPSRISNFPAPSTQDAFQKVLFSNPISFRDYLLSTNTSLHLLRFVYFPY